MIGETKIVRKSRFFVRELSFYLKFVLEPQLARTNGQPSAYPLIKFCSGIEVNLLFFFRQVEVFRKTYLI